MFIYKLWDFAIESNVHFPELHEWNGSAEWSFELRDSCAFTPDCEWFHEWNLPDGSVWLALGSQNSDSVSDYVLRFPRIADFLVTAGAKRIHCYPSPGIPAESIRHLLLDQVLPLVLSGPGKLVLHASAVASPQGAIAFLGRTGYGKSTLAASFSRGGFPLMTDDCLPIGEDHGQLFAVPSYPGLRLWPETIPELFALPLELSPVAHYSSKKRVDGGGLHFLGERISLARAYFLNDPDAPDQPDSPRIAAISARDVFIELVQFAFLMDIRDQSAVAAKFHIISLAAALPIFRRLSFSRQFSALPAVIEAVNADLQPTA